MKKLPGALAAALVGPMAIIGGAQAGQPPVVQGGGMNSAGWTLGFTGYDNPDKGQIQAVSPDGTRYNVKAECVTVSGDQAVIGGRVKGTNEAVRIFLEDNQPGNSGTNPDRAEFRTDTNDCNITTPQYQMVTGDVNIK